MQLRANSPFLFRHTLKIDSDLSLPFSRKELLHRECNAIKRGKSFMRRVNFEVVL
jgi:hypothetical protein